MSDFDVSQYLSIFLDEAEEQLQELDQGILRLEKVGGDEETLNRVFRAAHTLKGSSASMGFEKMATLTHAMENVLDKLRHCELEADRGIVDLLLSCLDALQNLKQEIAGEGEAKSDVEALAERLRAAAQGAGDLGSTVVFPLANKPLVEKQEEDQKETTIQLDDVEGRVARAADQKGFNVYHCTVTLVADCLMKAARAYIVFNNLKDYGDVIKTVPSTEDIEAERFDQTFELVLISAEEEEFILNVIRTITEIKAVSVRRIKFDKDSAPAEAEIAAARKLEPVTFSNEEPVTKTEKKLAQTVRVDVQRLENLMNLVGELVIDKTRLADVGNSLKTKLGAESLVDALEEVSIHIGRITTDLQEEIMKARMFPIEQVFNRFPRMIRDLARKAGKEVNFVVEGRETELDRTVIEEIGDPLIHLLRNAVDHGLEPPEERERSGKPREGKLLLKAMQQENQIVILVRDDGRGIDPEAIKRKAVTKGLISFENAVRLSRREAVNLIFLPGFSTADQVSDVSGRGVGMDIVRNHLERINGMIEIDTQLEKGTTFTVKLPLTLAINRSLLVNSAGRIFAFPLANVVEIVQANRSAIRKVQRQEVVVVRGDVLPLVSLEKALGGKAPAEMPESFPVVVAGISERRIGFVVRSLLGEQEIVIKGLGDFIGQVPGIAGATILGDGGIALILDIRGLVDRLGVEKTDDQAC